MPRTERSSGRLLPNGLRVTGMSPGTKALVLRAESDAGSARCPLCGSSSKRVHSRYARTVSDLPSRREIAATLEVRARRFFRDREGCGRRIFCERLGEVAARARKTDRLEEALLAIALKLGGEAGARLARELGLLVNPDVLLAQARRPPRSPNEQVRVLGVDDFAFKKGNAYGTILVDLERRKVVDLLPECSRESWWPGCAGTPGWRWRPATAPGSIGKA